MCLSFLASGMGNMSSTDQRKMPRRPSLSNTERHLEYQGTAKVCPPSWGAKSLGSSFRDSQRICGALTDANRVSKKAVKRSSAAREILGKVRNWCKLAHSAADNYQNILYNITPEQHCCTSKTRTSTCTSFPNFNIHSADHLNSSSWEKKLRMLKMSLI